MKKLKGGSFTLVLVLVIVILLGIIAYTLLIKPAINAFVVAEQNKGYTQGYFFAVASLMQQGVSCQPVPVYFGNYTLHMIATECLPEECLQPNQLQVNLS